MAGSGRAWGVVLALALACASPPVRSWDGQPPAGAPVTDLGFVVRLPPPVSLAVLAGLQQAVATADPHADLTALAHGTTLLEAVLFDTGQDWQLEALRRLALELARHRFGADSPQVALALASLAAPYGFSPRDPSSAEGPARAALAMARRHAARLPAHAFPGFLESLAHIELALERPAAAAALRREALDYWRGVLEPGHIALEPRLRAMAEARVAAGDAAGAELPLREAAAILRQWNGPDDPRRIAVLVELAQVLELQGRSVAARAEWVEAVRLAEAALAGLQPGAPALLRRARLADLARLRHAAGSSGGAVAALAEAAALPGSADDTDLAAIARMVRAGLAADDPGAAVLDATWPGP